MPASCSCTTPRAIGRRSSTRPSASLPGCRLDFRRRASQAPRLQPQLSRRDPARDRAEILQTIVDLRRALDLLAARPDVDAARLAYVAYSLGATMGVRLIGVEPRVRAVVLTAGYPALSHTSTHGTRTGDVAFRSQVPAHAQQAWLDAIAPLDGVRFVAAARPSVPTLL
jgi:dienelactone hydrolase